MTDKGRKIFNMVLAILVSVGAWFFVVYNYDPMTEIKYSDVPVTFIGETALAERGLAVSETENEEIGVVLNQRRIDAGRISSEDISVTADVSDCYAGDNSVTLTVKGPEDTTVVSHDTDSIGVTVGRSKTATMDINVIYSEDAEEGTEPVSFDLSQSLAEVSCTRDTLSKIDKIAAVLEYSEVTDKVKSFTARLTALDRDGNTLQHVVIEPEEISLDACAGYTKTVSLTVPVKNKNTENYERTYTVPETVTIKGPEDKIGNIGTIRAKEIDISYLYENAELPVEYNLPEDVYIAKESEGQTVKISVREKESSRNNDD